MTTTQDFLTTLEDLDRFVFNEKEKNIKKKTDSKDSLKRKGFKMYNIKQFKQEMI